MEDGFNPKNFDGPEKNPEEIPEEAISSEPEFSGIMRTPEQEAEFQKEIEDFKRRNNL